MSPLRQALAGYLAIRRSLGCKLARPEKLLGQFITYLEDTGAATVTTEHALAWATMPGGDASWHALRLSAARGFATYLRTIDPCAEVPPADLIPWRLRRATPCLYSDADISALITAAAGLRFPLRTATCQTLVGLLAVTGMRIGEAIRLDRADLDSALGLLTVRDSKFGKSRLVPLHPATVTALRGYLRLRDRLQPHPSAPAVFISPAGTRLLYCNVHATFQQLARRARLQPRSASCRPRIHDLRHSFAVRSLLDAYAAGQDGQARLTLLSTYLGHAGPAATYWYLSAAPELLALAGQRLEDHLQERP
ncbi:MAG: tyrosine-type recombinase/integrase [Streptosporangiaceae bacterium]|jgi:integrase